MSATVIAAAEKRDPPPHIRAHTAMRGVAALIVVAFHLRGADAVAAIEPVLEVSARGYLFVDLFFILSGFVLTYVYAQAGPMGRGALRGFLAARIARIYPLHAVTGAMMLALLFVTSDGWPSPVHLVTQATLTHAWGLTDVVVLNYPSWSISAELFAYLAFPALLWWRSRSRAVFVAAGAAFALGFYAVIGGGEGVLEQVTGLAVLRCLAAFWIGMMLPPLSARLATAPAAALSVQQAAAILAIGFGFAAGVGDVFFVPPFAALVALTACDRGVVARMLAGSVLFRLGLVSYSVYLLHVPVIRAATLAHYWLLARLPDVDPVLTAWCFAACVAAATIAASLVTYPLVEVAGRRWLLRVLRGGDAKAPTPASVPASA